MTRINLLPYREERRVQRRRQMLGLLGVSAIAGLAVAILVHGLLAGQLSNQQSRNTLLNDEIKKLEKQIEDIKAVKEETKALLDRKQVVETLQTNRADAVHILDQMLRQLPEGVYLKSVKQVGDTITMSGYAQSNSRVSSLMRNLDASPWLESPSLIEIKAVTVDKVRANEFNMTIKLERPKAEEKDKPGSKPNAAGAKTT